MTSRRIAVVTPVYEDNEASARLFHELAKELGEDLFVVAVDDGSVRERLDVAALNDARAPGVVLRLKRNVGHQRAIAIGLSYVAENVHDVERVVVMDSDGEDLPASIQALLSSLGSNVDVAVAERRSRVETLRFRAFYLVYKIIFGALTGRKISFGNFMAMTPGALRRLTVMQELWTHVAAAVLGSKLRLALCPLDRGPRYAGRSKMNFVGLALHGFKALMVFAEDVMVRVGIMCVLISGFAIIGAFVAVVLKLVGFTTPGWFSVALGVLFLVFLQTAALTLMTLMLSGLGSRTAVKANSHEEFVESVTAANPAPAG